MSYYREPTTRAELRGTYVTSAQGHIEADANGRFQVDNLPAGTYSVQVSGLAFNSRGYEVKVVRDGRPRPPLSLAIVPNPAVAEYLRLHPRETAFIATTQIPTYPIEALKAGIEGSVTMKVTPGRVPVAAGGPPLLVAAATAFARTWKTASSNNEPFDVSVKYRLAEGDCVGGGPRVVLRFPREVEITGKRIVPCGPG